MPKLALQIDDLPGAVRDAYPELAPLHGVPEPVYLVGGAVRDLLLGSGRADLDLVVVGDPLALAERLGAPRLAEHGRFATARVDLDGHEVDLASARTETYARPGALPQVEPAEGVVEDLRRRDFTVNAMAVPLSDGAGPRVPLIDTHGGHEDLEAGVLRILQPHSFADDPTRAIRAARYASRFDLELEPETGRRLREADLATISAERRWAELLRLAGEASAPRGLALLVEWGLVESRPGGVELASAVASLLESGPWEGEVLRAEALLDALLGPVGREQELAAEPDPSPSRGVELAAAATSSELALARALGATWLDTYLREWRSVELEIGGDDLLAAGVPAGPALGRGIQAALRARLDGEISSRDAELATALAAARAE